MNLLHWIITIEGIGREENNVSGNRDVPILDPKNKKKVSYWNLERVSYRVGSTLARRRAYTKVLRQERILVIISQTFG